MSIKEGASPANVKIKVGGGIIRLPITDETVEQLKLARGKTGLRSPRDSHRHQGPSRRMR